jgi:hypothetical protein
MSCGLRRGAGLEADGGVIFNADAFVLTNRKLAIDLAARHRLPAIYGIPTRATQGGLNGDRAGGEDAARREEAAWRAEKMRWARRLAQTRGKYQFHFRSIGRADNVAGSALAVSGWRKTNVAQEGDGDLETSFARRALRTDTPAVHSRAIVR